MYMDEEIEFVMMSRVGILPLSGDFGIFRTCESGMVDVCDSSSISYTNTVKLVIVLVIEEKGMFFRIIRLSMSFVLIFVVIS
jgi:hypothetical protein